MAAPKWVCSTALPPSPASARPFAPSAGRGRVLAQRSGVKVVVQSRLTSAGVQRVNISPSRRCSEGEKVWRGTPILASSVISSGLDHDAEQAVGDSDARELAFADIGDARGAITSSTASVLAAASLPEMTAESRP